MMQFRTWMENLESLGQVNMDNIERLYIYADYLEENPTPWNAANYLKRIYDIVIMLYDYWSKNTNQYFLGDDWSIRGFQKQVAENVGTISNAIHQAMWQFEGKIARQKGSVDNIQTVLKHKLRLISQIPQRVNNATLPVQIPEPMTVGHKKVMEVLIALDAVLDRVIPILNQIA